MKKNMNLGDRGFRIAIAIVIVAAYFFGLVHGTLAVVLLVVAGIFALTSLVGFCPLYRLFHYSSMRKKPGEKSMQA